MQSFRAKMRGMSVCCRGFSIGLLIPSSASVDAKNTTATVSIFAVPSAPFSAYRVASINTYHFPIPFFCSRVYRSVPRFSSLRRRFTVGEVMSEGTISYLSKKEAAEIDELLMGPLGFSVDQLMELAGLSVAASIAQVYASSDHARVLVICGPGNNGGDGLVCARHLHHFGYKPFVCYPKRTAKPLYTGLVTQLEALSVKFLSVGDLPHNLSDEFDLIVDAMFGFSFHGIPRPPFDDLIQRISSLNGIGNKTRSPSVISVDIPSGWHVEEGDVSGEGIKSDMLVSLTAPKLCARKFVGPHHFLGGRFVPPFILDKFSLKLPHYPGTDMCVRIGESPTVDISAMRENYVSPELLEDQVMADPTDQFCKWFNEAVTAGLREPNAMALSTSSMDGKTSSRMVLLKGVDKEGFVWYTNYQSRKAQDLSANPFAALLFYWNSLNRQVRVEGSVEKVSVEESDAYFHSRAHGSQLGAVVSNQSAPVSGRDVLLAAYRELEAKYAYGRISMAHGSEREREEKYREKARGRLTFYTNIFLSHTMRTVIPRPEHWGGYRLKPILFEFWQGQPCRLHDRLQYSLREVDGKQSWHISRLAP